MAALRGVVPWGLGATPAASATPLPTARGGQRRGSSCWRAAALAAGAAGSALARQPHARLLQVACRRAADDGAAGRRASSREASHAAPSSSTPAGSTLAGLQGHWEGLTTGVMIEVVGDEVDFYDGTDRWKVTEAANRLELRGAHFCGGLPELAAWRRGDGSQEVWQRADPELVQSAAWAKLFMDYKLSRTRLRQDLCLALEEDLTAAAELQERWDGMWDLPQGTTLERELRLAAGRFLVPGVCVRHRSHGFRAVVLGCEPWVRAPMARQLGLAQDAAGAGSYRLQPIYCCLLDDRDCPEGGGAVFVPERDLEPAPDAFPQQSRFAGPLLKRRDAVRGYTPGKYLKLEMRRQQLGIPFMLKP